MSRYRTEQIASLAEELHHLVEQLARHQAAIKLLTELHRVACVLHSYKYRDQ